MKATGDRNQHKPEPPAIRNEEEVSKIHAGNWQEWVASLTADERAELKRLGLSAPKPLTKRRQPRTPEDEDNHPVGTCDHLSSNDLISSEAHLNPYEALAAKDDEAKGINKKKRELTLLNQALPKIHDSLDPRLEASIVALALKIGARQGITIAKLAARHQVAEGEIGGRVRTWEVSLGVCRADVDLLSFVIAPILASRSPGLEAECIAKAARIGLNADRMEDVGAKHGVCRQAVSNRVRHWCEELVLPLPPECKQNTGEYLNCNVRKEVIDPFQP